MFRRLSSSLPKDFEYPADLEALGYYVNEKDQIRSITDPSQEFHFFISKNERVNEMQREAMNTCIRRNVISRLSTAGLAITRLPLGTAANEPHVPVLTSENISTAKRIIVYVGETVQDLGIFAYRTVSQESIAAGSAINFVNAIQSNTSEPPGIVIANIGQLIWHRRGKQAMTQVSWRAIPRKTAVDEPMIVDPVKNSVPRNESMLAHVDCVFEDVLGKLTNKEAKINVIGIGDGAVELVEYLQSDWANWEGRVETIVVGSSHIWNMQFHDDSFKDFWTKRARAYLISEEDVDTPLTGRDDFGCNCYSAGEGLVIECIMPKAYKNILRYIQLVADSPGYEAPEQYVPAKKVDTEEAE